MEAAGRSLIGKSAVGANVSAVVRVEFGKLTYKLASNQRHGERMVKERRVGRQGLRTACWSQYDETSKCDSGRSENHY
jgi:hypothetical protein